VNNYKQHIAFRIATLLTVVCLVLPSVVKFSHLFTHHEHEVCIGKNQSHLHELDLDCEFYKFNLSNSFYVKSEEYFKLTINLPSLLLNTEYHSFLKSHQQLTTYLRGPPYLM